MLVVVFVIGVVELARVGFAGDGDAHSAGGSFGVEGFAEGFVGGAKAGGFAAGVFGLGICGQRVLRGLPIGDDVDGQFFLAAGDTLLGFFVEQVDRDCVRGVV